jgi:DNA-binding MarR family transcriptional regulator
MPRRRAPDHDFGVLLGLAYQAFVDHLNARLAEHGFADIRPAFGYVFRALAEQELTSGQLATRLGITAQGAGKLVDQMVDAGYVSRRLDTTDRRTKWLNLTARGRAALATAHQIHQDVERQLAADIGAARVGTLRQALRHLAEADAPGDAPRTLRLP